MFCPDDTIVAVATPPGRGGIGVVRVSGPAARDDRVGVDRASGAAGAPARHAGAGACRRSRRDRSRGADVLSRAAFLHGRRRSGDQRARQPRAPARHRRRRHEGGSAAGRAWRVHVSRVSAWTYRSRAGRGRARSRRSRHAVAGARGLRSARRDADVAHSARSTRRCSIFPRAWKRLLDFPDEGYHFVEPGSAASREILAIVRELDALLADASRGRLIREGAQVVDSSGGRIAGKSSLFNRLAGAGRAIVTDIAWNDPRSFDRGCRYRRRSASRSSTPQVSRRRYGRGRTEGIARAHAARRVADLVIVVLDRSRPLDEDDGDFSRRPRAGRAWSLANKSDLPAAWPIRTAGVDLLAVSAKSGARHGRAPPRHAHDVSRPRSRCVTRRP